MYQIIENGKVIHESPNKGTACQWAFVLKYTQGRKVRVQLSPKN
ncbi:hypothetical protein [Klebsiella phage PCCM_KpP1172]|nr:hypothetical protein [Klebsiella phage PCCM_KpP1172]